LRLIHAIASKKKGTKVADNDGDNDAEDDIAVAPPSPNVGDRDADRSSLTSPKSDAAAARSITPMELEDGRSFRSQQCIQVVTSVARWYIFITKNPNLGKF
jgi:hypothetical protein